MHKNIRKDIVNLKGKLVNHHRQHGLTGNDVKDQQKSTVDDNDVGVPKVGSLKQTNCSELLKFDKL